MNADQLAPQGISGDLWWVQCKPEQTAEEIQRSLADQTEREFELRCIFFRDAGFSRDIDAQAQFDTGTSFFAIADRSDPGWFENSGLRFEVMTNQDGEIAGVLGRVRARSPHQARELFTNSLIPILDHLAYASNKPLITSSVVCHDETHLAWVVGYTSPYSTSIVNPGVVICHTELAPVYALYREAKNATSPFYRFFSYYKILEGIFHSLRPNLFKVAAERGIALQRRREVIPEHVELRAFAADLIGRPVKDYFDNVLQKKFRDAVAHFITDSGIVLSPSEPRAAARFTDIILPTEICCRVVIEQHERYLDEVNGFRR